MIKKGIINPQVLEMLASVRHMNTFVICDMGYPFFPEIPTIDLSIRADLPTVLQVLEAIQGNYEVGKIWMASEFLDNNDAATIDSFRQVIGEAELIFEPHAKMKERLPHTIAIIRTGDTTRYANMIIESAENNTER
ncbi:MAG: RbsD/FucU family protein [Anaerolineaceae bacterium]|nr:RbsD/FucU family protein [Anaerolineaceae bacterium]